MPCKRWKVGIAQPEQATGTGVQVYCPTGSGTDRQPSPLDIWVVLGMGTIGGSLASMVSIRNMTASTSPYDVPVALSRLKVPAGALTAMIGLIALRGGFVPGLSELDSQQQIIAYALVFGYAQQLATGFLDQRAQKLQETDVAPVPTSNGLNGGGTTHRAPVGRAMTVARPSPRRWPPPSAGSSAPGASYGGGASTSGPRETPCAPSACTPSPSASRPWS